MFINLYEESDMLDASDGFEMSSKCSLRTKDSWFSAFCWTALFMSCFVGLLPLIGWKIGAKHQESKDALVGLMQMSFVGSVYFPILLFIKWKRGDWMVPLHMVLGVFTVGAAITVGTWLGNSLLEQRTLLIAVLAPLGAGMLFGMKRLLDFASLPNRR